MLKQDVYFLTGNIPTSYLTSLIVQVSLTFLINICLWKIIHVFYLQNEHEGKYWIGYNLWMLDITCWL